MAETYTSAFERLKSLPEIFTGSDVTTIFRWTSQTASTYLANWRRAGLVESLGGRSDVHMNLVRNPSANREAALRRVFPHATKIGADVLREAGWTTQIMSSPEVAVPRGSSYAVNGFALSPRSEKWFQQVSPGIIDNPVGLRALAPAWALADMIARAKDRRVGDAWLLAPDDIDLEAVAADPQTKAAIKSFGLRKADITADGYEGLYDATEAISTNRQAA